MERLQEYSWKVATTGPGASSPIPNIEIRNRYLVFRLWRARSKIERNSKLKRHIQCFDRQSGNEVWSDTIPAEMPEDPYQGKGVPEHGYATNTPATDGESVYVFLGKSGVAAYDLTGKRLWKTSVGKESGNREWGSAASLLLYRDMVIVNASEESQTIYAIDKRTGETIWRSAASSLELCYGTPAIVHVSEDRDDLVIAVPGEIWALIRSPVNWFGLSKRT